MFDFGIKDAIDILCVALLLYYIYKLMKSSGSLNVFYGILIFIVTWIVVSQVLEMKLLGSIFDKLVSVGVLALIVLFQEDIRRFLLTLGSHRRMSAFVNMFRPRSKADIEAKHTAVMQIVRACAHMSKNLVGALIVVERNFSLNDIVKSGEYINADINQQLIKNIFFKNSPLHDGAMIISHGRIVAAACILPVSHNENIPKELGLRHRAAIGMTEQSDAVAIIVSEETGDISIARKGTVKRNLSTEELELLLDEHLVGEVKDKR